MKDKKRTTQDSPRKKGKITPSWPIIYGLVGPSGRDRGVFQTEWEAWAEAFYIQPFKTKMRIDKTDECYRRALQHLGWRVVKGRFVEEGGAK